MSPIRLIILAILLYIGYLLIRGSIGRKKADKKQMGGPTDVSDILVEDPICKKLVPKGQAVPIEHEGETIYFCSEKCCKEFTSDKGAQE